MPDPLKAPYAALVSSPDVMKQFVKALLKGKPLEPFRSWSEYSAKRGMSKWHDIVDWVRGYPYEVATPDEIFDFYRDKGFRLTRLRVGGVGLGCNEFVFHRESSPENTEDD